MRSRTKAECPAEVVDPRTLWPLDQETIIGLVSKTRHCVVVTEAPAEGGFRGELATAVMEDCLSDLIKPVKQVCGMRIGVPYPTSRSP